MTQLTLKPVVSKKLFSKYYLEKRLARTKIWKESTGLDDAFKKIQELYKKEHFLLEKYSESQLEKNFIKPILDILKHIFEVQASVRRGYRKPDYAFFKNEKDRREAIMNKDTEDFYKEAIAVGDAKKWELELDKKSPSGAMERKFQNPSYQIYWYLEETPPEWGILTNGRKWRLYHANTARKLDVYYEVDLVDLIERGDREKFKYFYLFFRKESFVPHPARKCFLDQVLEESIIHAEKISEDLKENVYEALRILANGFFDWSDNNLKKNKETIKEVHDNCLIFLYRILFVLYAESQNMLTKKVTEAYNYYYIESLIEEIIEKIDSGKEIALHTNDYWGKLTGIFNLINRGSKKLKIPEDKFEVPAYNGDLFDQRKHRFLMDNIISDRHIAQAIDLLTRVESEEYGGRVRVDYSDLSVRHLGSIYEGLLEFKLELAKEEMVAVKQGGKLVWKEKSIVEKNRIYDRAKEGELYPVTDKGERKATGSYYTPDYIVKYIVKNTLGPILEEKLKNAKTDEEKREAILLTKVLDPAMGSGHFLVEATDFLAHKLVEVIESEETEEDIAKAKRDVVKHCIYGVDINPLATELAKVSLWLHTLAEDKPLSFLSHHLKTGNSLTGARLNYIASHPEKKLAEEQKTLASFGVDIRNIRDDIRRLIEMYKEIMDMPENKPEDIHEAEEIYHKFKEHKRRKWFNLLADVHVSYYFENKFSEIQYKKLIDIFQTYQDWKWNDIIKEEWIRSVTDSLPDYLREEDKSTEKVSSKRGFFHWELEFPEIFFDTDKGDYKEDPGFDVVIGNPPYGAELTELERGFLSKRFNTAELYINTGLQFIELCSVLTKNCGSYGQIVPKSLSYAQKWSLGRNLILPKLKTAIDVSRAFEDVLYEQMIFIVGNSSRESYLTARGSREEFTQTVTVNKELCKETDTIILDTDENSLLLLEKIAGINNLGQITETSRGLPYQKYRIKKGDHKVYSGKHIKRYFLRDTEDSIEAKHIDEKKEKIRFLRQSKVISQRIVAHVTSPTDRIIIMSTLDRDGILTLDTIENTILTDNRYDLEFITTLLNSELFSWYGYEFIFSKAIRSMDLDNYYISKFPLPIVEFNGVYEKLVKNTRKILSLHKKKMKETGNFLLWISREWDCDIEDLSLKSHLREYWEYDFIEMLRIAKKNESRIKGDPASRGFQEILEKELRNSMNVLLPLLEEIQCLENENNILVFELFKLNEKQIRMVLESLGKKKSRF